MLSYFSPGFLSSFGFLDRPSKVFTRYEFLKPVKFTLVSLSCPLVVEHK